nr:hypothetical protein [Nanoarchaeota archaeon]
MIKKAHVELHVHPNFKAYGLEAVVKAMDRNGLNAVALLHLDKPIFSELQTLSYGLNNKIYRVDLDDPVIRVERKRDDKQFYIIKGVELNTSDDPHLLMIGYDTVPKYLLLEKDTIELGLENKAFAVSDHRFVKIPEMCLPIGKKKQEQVEKICKNFSGKIALEWNGYCLDLYWETGKRIFGLFGWKNVNEEVIKLSKRLKEGGYNVPVVTDSDIHAKDILALEEIGTARIISEIDVTSGRTLVDSLKQNIFSGKYENTYKTVSLRHFVPYFAIPHAAQKLFKIPSN